jgi:hypothetical protein
MPQISNPTLLVVAVVIVCAVVVVAWAISRKRRHERLRDRFGAEYDRTVNAVGTTGRADAVLEERERRVEKYHITPLDERQRARFAEEWRRVQAVFVDDPAAAVTQADALVTEVMSARGYPMADFDRRVEDLTVEHGSVVQHYRAAREIAERHARHAATTEDLRQALVHYRELFADLLDGNPVRRTA